MSPAPIEISRNAHGDVVVDTPDHAQTLAGWLQHDLTSARVTDRLLRELEAVVAGASASTTLLWSGNLYIAELGPTISHLWFAGDQRDAVPTIDIPTELLLAAAREYRRLLDAGEWFPVD